MRWIDALKIWNEGNDGKWCIPKRNSPEHAQVLEIMKGRPLKEAPKKEKIKIKKSKIKEAQARRKALTTGQGLILPGRQQRGGGDLPWDVILDIAQNPMDYINKAGRFLDSQNASKQMAKQIERETGNRRLFKMPWE